MANRVVIGDRAGVMGMWISRPGSNVLTAAEAEMLFVASNVLNTKSFQTVQNGYFVLSTDQSIDIAFPYMGILPVVMVWTDSYVNNPFVQDPMAVQVLGCELSFPSTTVARFTGRNPYGSYTAGFRYVITNQSLY